jgi:hypothetical protein
MEWGAQWCNRLGLIFPSKAGLILPSASAGAALCKGCNAFCNLERFAAPRRITQTFIEIFLHD